MYFLQITETKYLLNQVLLLDKPYFKVGIEYICFRKVYMTFLLKTQSCVRSLNVIMPKALKMNNFRNISHKFKC